MLSLDLKADLTIPFYDRKENAKEALLRIAYYWLGSSLFVVTEGNPYENIQTRIVFSVKITKSDEIS